MVGVAGDDGAARQRGAHAEDLADAALGAEDVLDLALGEAQHLRRAGQRDDRRLGERRGLGRLDRSGGGRWRFADEVGEGRLLGAGGTLGDAAHLPIVTEIGVDVRISQGAIRHSLQS